MDPALDLLALCHPCVWRSASFGECVACVFDHDIRIFSLEDTSKPFRVLCGHLDRILSICVHPLNPMQLLSFDAAGNAITWDVYDGNLVNKFSFGIPICFSHASSQGVIIIYKDDRKFFLGSYPWATDQQPFVQSPAFTINCHLLDTFTTESVTVGCENRFLAMLTGPLSIAVHDMQKEGRETSLHIPKRFLVRENVHLTTLALHPHLDHLAGGLSSGEIVLWRGGLRRRKKKKSAPPRRKKRRKDSERTYAPATEELEEEEEEEEEASIITRLHWHPLAVQCLSYSANGAFLLSGGHEAVLVKWDLTGGASSSQRRTLLPRLRAPLAAVGPGSERLTFVLLRDRSLLLLSGPAFETAGLVHGRLLRAAPSPCGRAFGGACVRHLCGLTHDPRRNDIIAGARPGHLQWLPGGAELDVTGENYVPLEPPRGGDPTESCATEVVLVAVTADGTVLASYEALPLGDTGRFLRRLKWWLREADEADWRLMHCATTTHHAAFTAMAFASSELLAAVGGGAVVIWGRTWPEEVWNERHAWDCGLEAPPGGACVFRPGAEPLLLAASAGCTLGLWRWPETPLAPGPALGGSVELEEEVAQLMWPSGVAGTILLARIAPSGDVLAWHAPSEEPSAPTDLQTPAFRIALSATAMAVQMSDRAEWVAVCTRQRECLLVELRTGAVLRRLQTTGIVCCAAVTAEGLLLGLSEREECLDRLWTIPRKTNGLVELPQAPVRRPGGLLGKLEALAAQQDGRAPAVLAAEGEERHRQRLAEAASARMRDRLHEFVHCSANCAPDLEQLALAMLRLQTEMTLQQANS